MDSLLDHLARKERDRLRVVSVDVEEDPVTARRFRVRKVPTLVLVKDERTVARVEGRAKAADLEELVETHLRTGHGNRRSSKSVVSVTKRGEERE